MFLHLEKKRVFGWIRYLFVLPKFPAPGCRSSFWLKSVSDVDRIIFHVEKKIDDRRALKVMKLYLYTRSTQT